MSLPRLDFSTLSYNAAKWSLPGKVLLGCALAGLVLAIGEVSHGGPQRERLHGLEAREQALQQQLTEKSDLAASLELRTRQVRSMEDNLASLLGQLPGESEVPAVLEDIARLAAVHGVWVEGITVLDEAPRQLYIEQPMQISASGVYHDLATFVSALGGLPRVVTVQDIALAAFFVVEYERQRNACLARPVGVRRVTAVTDQVAWVVSAHCSLPSCSW